MSGENDRGDLFAAMLALEANKLLFRMAALLRQRKTNCKIERRTMMLIDVKRVHFDGKCGKDDRVYVPAPKGWSRPGMCWRSEEVVVWNEAGSKRIGSKLFREVVLVPAESGSLRADNVLGLESRAEVCCALRQYCIPRMGGAPPFCCSALAEFLRAECAGYHGRPAGRH